MANEEQLSILKQGVQVWNKWRKKNPFVEIDLSRADLKGTNLREVRLIGAFLKEADLRKANLGDADLRMAKLIGANLSEADLRDTRLRQADLREANLRNSDFHRADLREANLKDANLSKTYFSQADLSDTKLGGGQFFSAEIGSTILGHVDLSEALGLDEVKHFGPSRVSTDTLMLSKGKIPEVFLKGCGLSNWEVQQARLFNPELSNSEINEILYKMYDLRATQALQISPLFISYSHGDGEFVDKFENQLNAKGIRFWRDIHDMKAGRMEKQIDRAIRQNPTVLLVLSENSLNSDWVEHEVRTARQLEKEKERDVLCPVALDDSWKSSRWPKRLMEQIMEYNILDFSEWQNDVKFEGMFRRLIDGLELFYKG